MVKMSRATRTPWARMAQVMPWLVRPLEAVVPVKLPGRGKPWQAMGRVWLPGRGTQATASLATWPWEVRHGMGFWELAPCPLWVKKGSANVFWAMLVSATTMLALDQALAIWACVAWAELWFGPA